MTAPDQEKAPAPFTCSVCEQEKPARERATLSYTDTSEPLGPELCGECAYQGMLWAAIMAKRAREPYVPTEFPRIFPKEGQKQQDIPHQFLKKSEG